ncbi:3-(methylthio)propionyl-CoA ligase [Aquabacterium sp.]|jgi:acyl-CoA synthetase (AMP-forming)/AMP-acid ligase II|uniref:3-(methylthio)propionyl-CoA ligase n=1 Tax=Aquabacterium sp. TaxID=1872578 RepID=UPI0025BD0D04|nr:3-(methylthio)propionyl-CoA ligase [Aquabacterium sp.]MDQ5925094.1 3-(methylthio)propionyl---CoA ligase [Pseudomonadota bacterium]
MSLMGQMMQMPLLISSLLTHAARHNGDVEVVSKRVEGDMHRTHWAGVELRSRKLAQALGRLGCEPGDRIGTLAWNGYRHLEIYYGVSGSQLVCHTINPRLFPQQVAWIVNDAQDKVIFVDLNILPLVEKLLPMLPTVKHVVLMCDRDSMPREHTLPSLLCYEDLIEAEDGNYTWPSFDENAAASICYTSGTTGNPKGAVYSHRSSVLHAYAVALPDAMCIKGTDVILPVVPMFHVNAWGTPYAAALVGCKLVLPGHHLDGASLFNLFEDEGVTMSAGVPTIWMGLLNHVKANNLKFSTFKTTVIGGAACPPSMIRTFENDYNVEVVHAWGMTELSPVGTLGRLKSKHASLPLEARQKILEKQGKSVFGVDMRIVDADGNVQPWNGVATGDLEVRGHWVIDSYFNVDKSPLHDGWFPTGDVATIDADGYMQITDRSKDVIKSGGEWISSIELENVLMAHPAVHEAAAIAAHHPKWDERPLMVVVKKPDAEVTKEELLAFFKGKIPNWQTPDDVVFVDELPHTATGKLYKLKLREQFRDHKLPTA